MKFSYWEYKEWFSGIDFTVIGSGIVGLSCALALRKKHAKAKIIILEKGRLPQGASTKNAGFACVGSLSELIDDLKTHSETAVFQLVKKRWEGLALLRQHLGDKNIDYQQHKGYEIFNDAHLYSECMDHQDKVNQLLHPLFKGTVFSEVTNGFGFKNCHSKQSVNNFEGQLDTGKMMSKLVQLVIEKDIKIINNCNVLQYKDFGNKVVIQTPFIELETQQLCIATNGFSKQFLDEDVRPARAQVLITKPIKNLHIQGTFHLEKGYYYFRNIHQRILLGGGRNLDFDTEETTVFGETTRIQNKLKTLLQTTILPDTPFEIDSNWSGIMGVGNQKKAIVKQISNRVFCGIRLGGMGVAIGSLIGEELADLTVY